jgi:hypothetical protein
VVEASSAPQQGENAGGQSPVSGAQASQGSVLSFELNESVVNYVVPYEGKGLLEEIGIINKLSSETTFNLTSSNGSLLGFSEDMEPSLEFTTTDSQTDFGLYLNATNVSEDIKNLTVSVTNVERSESVSMDVNLKLVNVSVVYLSPTTNQKITDLLPERDLNGSLDIELNNSGLYDNKLKNFDYSILVDDAGTVKSCLDPEFTVSNGVLAISCRAPFVGADSAKDLRARVIFGGD